jgi:predicted esterase
VLVALHGTGGSGKHMVDSFRELAEQHGFAIAAPDSRKSPQGQLTWQVADKPGEVTPDYTHAIACFNELPRHADGQALLQGKVLVAGYSGGASSAPYLATHYDAFSAFAVLHGGVFTGGFGHRSPRGWFSTGDRDTIRTPEHVRAAAQTAGDKIGTPTVYREFPGGHELSTAETKALIEWWLQGT